MLEVLESIKLVLNYAMIVVFAIYMAYYGISRILGKYNRKFFIAYLILFVIYFSYSCVIDCVNKNVTWGILDVLLIIMVVNCFEPIHIDNKSEKTSKEEKKDKDKDKDKKDKDKDKDKKE